jgi:hypothetical protein
MYLCIYSAKRKLIERVQKLHLTTLSIKMIQNVYSLYAKRFFEFKKLAQIDKAMHVELRFTSEALKLWRQMQQQAASLFLLHGRLRQNNNLCAIERTIVNSALIDGETSARLQSLLCCHQAAGDTSY